MDRIGIISGGGILPLSIGKSLIDKSYEVCFFTIKKFADPYIYKEYQNVEIELTSFSKILDALKNKKIDKLILVGKIIRPSIRDIKFDLSTLSLIKNFFLESKGDDQLLKSISIFFLNKGYPLFDWKNICDELFSSKENLTSLIPSESAIKNKNKGLEVFKHIGMGDIGQSMIIQNQLILGIECIEGTDQLIKRCYDYKKIGDRGILLKLSKYKQHLELDIPTIGLETMQNIKKYDYEGLFIEKNNCVIIEKDKIIDFCNQNKIFLSTVSKVVEK